MVRTKSTTVDDPPCCEIPVGMGYCGADSAEFGPVWTGDLGRSGKAAFGAIGPQRLAPLRI